MKVKERLHRLDRCFYLRQVANLAIQENGIRLDDIIAHSLCQVLAGQRIMGQKKAASFLEHISIELERSFVPSWTLMSLAFQSHLDL